MTDIRLLRADEIECRVGTEKDKKVMLLLYKDARVDMNILDEVFGTDGWQRTHEVINGNLFCNIEIWSEEKKQWIKKQDVGVESKTEKEKGEASDSFKRAGFNVGIGRELYTAPQIKFKCEDSEYWTPPGKNPVLTSKFFVKEIGYNKHREINALTIIDQKGKERYKLGQGEQEKEDDKPKVTPEPKQPESQQPTEDEYKDNLLIALQEVEDCQLLIELESIWKKWPMFQKDSNFKIAVTSKKPKCK